MKQFFRTAPGKAMLFIVCLLSVAGFILSAAGAAFCVYYGDMIYSSRSSEELAEHLNDRQFEVFGYSAAVAAVKSETIPAVLEEHGNLLMRVTDTSGTVLAESDVTAEVPEWGHSKYYECYPSTWEEEEWYEAVYLGSAEPDRLSREGSSLVIVSFALEDGLPNIDAFRFISFASSAGFALRYWIFVLAVLMFASAVLSFIALMFVSGRRQGTEEVVPGLLNRVPFDLLAAVTAAVAVAGAMTADSSSFPVDFIVAAVTVLYSICGLLGLCMSAAARSKEHTLIKNTVIYRVCMLAAEALGIIWGLFKKLMRLAGKVLSYFWHGITEIPVSWKTALIYAGISFAELFWCGMTDADEATIIVLLLERIVLFPAVLAVSASLKKLRDGGKALAAGDLSYYTDTSRMFWDLKRHGEDLNSIAQGMAIAVEDRLKSERMKTELITNVSHDIKTPLTSIINYASLIGEEECDNEKIKEYSEVLVRQSDKLKRLIEDLVEASKASTGNLDVQMVPCDASVFLDQASGEYSEKLAESELTLVTTSTDRELRIMADGRRMWRIFDNLMNNICKYALAGTRVYLSLEEEGGNAVFTFKNTSRDALNISEEELMERFTRGDSSRSTEGNGLGLSIARSMAELQNGSLRVAIDGDLFKAILAFPVLK